MPLSKGVNVEKFQRLLSEAGYNLAIDGIYGPETESVVKALQKSSGLPVTGIPNADTVAVLQGKLKGDRTLGPIEIKGNVPLYLGGAAACLFAYWYFTKD